MNEIFKSGSNTVEEQKVRRLKLLEDRISGSFDPTAPKNASSTLPPPVPPVNPHPATSTTITPPSGGIFLAVNQQNYENSCFPSFPTGIHAPGSTASLTATNQPIVSIDPSSNGSNHSKSNHSLNHPLASSGGGGRETTAPKVTGEKRTRPANDPFSALANQQQQLQQYGNGEGSRGGSDSQDGRPKSPKTAKYSNNSSNNNRGGDRDNNHQGRDENDNSPTPQQENGSRGSVPGSKQRDIKTYFTLPVPASNPPNIYSALQQQQTNFNITPNNTTTTISTSIDVSTIPLTKSQTTQSSKSSKNGKGEKKTVAEVESKDLTNTNDLRKQLDLTRLAKEQAEMKVRKMIFTFSFSFCFLIFLSSHCCYSCKERNQN